jgi:hypothetical protein
MSIPAVPVQSKVRLKAKVNEQNKYVATIYKYVPDSQPGPLKLKYYAQMVRQIHSEQEFVQLLSSPMLVVVDFTARYLSQDLIA